MKEWRKPALILSVRALAVSAVSFVMSYLQSQRSAVTAVMPVLAFAYGEDGRWTVQNLGNGPALNVVVAERADDRAPWSNPVRLPPARLGPCGPVGIRGLLYPVRCPYAALDALLTEHRLCRPGLDDPDVNQMLVALWCSCGAKIAVRLPPLPGGA
jgi:hypothetical protein